MVPVTAALTPEVPVGPRARLQRRGKSVPWQERVKDYDRNGPGVAGYYLDTVALMAMLCPLYVSVRNKSGDYERSDDPILQVALDAWRGALMAQPDLVYHAVRGRESLGRIWNIRDVETGHNVVTQITSVDDNRVGWRDLYGRQRISPIETPAGVMVWRSWYPDPYEQWEATSPMRRALPNLRRLRSIVRNQTRSSDSRMATNGIVSFPTDPTEVLSRPFAEGGGTGGQGVGGQRGVPQRIRDFIELSNLAHEDDESPAAMVPFPVEGPPPVWTEVGRQLDPMTLEAERVAIEGFARDVNFPQQLLTFGPGAANHWNEFMMQEVAVKLALAPKLQPVCNDVLVMHLQPMIARFRQELTEWRRSVDPRHVRVEFDLSFLLRRPSQVMEMIRCYELGIATRQQVAEEIGLKGEVLPLPNGMSEYEHWELSTNGKGAPYAEVDRENNLIVPDLGAGGPMGALPPAAPIDGAPPVDASAEMSQALGAGPGGGDLGAVTEPTAPPVVASLLPPVRRWSPEKARSVREQLAIAAAAKSPPDDESDRSAVVQTSVTAALPSKTEVTEDPRVATTRLLYADAIAGDVKLSAELTALLGAIAADIERAVARKVIQAHQPRSELRQRLSTLPLGEVWQNADPHVRAAFPLDETVAEEVERYQPQVQAAYEESAQTFLDKWGGVIAAALVVSLIPNATDAFTHGVEVWAVDRYRPRKVRPAAAEMRRAVGVPLDVNGPPGLGLVTQAGERAVPPTTIVRDSMMVAGGATQGRNDMPDRDGGGNPRPVEGGQWKGGTGFLIGHRVVTAAPVPPVRWRWRHAFIRRPVVAYEPHKDLDGKVYDKPSQVPGGFYPSDHKFCTCAMLPEV